MKRIRNTGIKKNILLCESIRILFQLTDTDIGNKLKKMASEMPSTMPQASTAEPKAQVIDWLVDLLVDWLVGCLISLLSVIASSWKLVLVKYNHECYWLFVS